MSGEITINCGAMRAAAIPYEGGPWSQGGVDVMWAAMGYPAPAPRVPASMVGMYQVHTRGPRMLARKPKGKKKDGLRHVNEAENKFLNFWGKAVTDPCRKQSGISKIAGGILQVAAMVVPAAGAFMFAAAEVGNAALDASKVKRDMAQATELLTQAAAATQQTAPVFQPTATAPPLIAPVSQLVPQPMSLVPRDRVSHVTQSPGSRWTGTDWATAGILGVAFYLLVRRIQR
jgi:hypothetical protein